MNEKKPESPTDNTSHLDSVKVKMYLLIKDMHDCFSYSDIKISEVSYCSFVLSKLYTF